AWPGEEAPRRPQRGTPPRGNPRGGGSPEWPAGDEGGPQWPAGDEPPRRPQRPRQQGQQGMPPRRAVPPPGQQRTQQGPPGSPPQGFRQPGNRPVPPPGREPDLITHHAHNGTDDLGRDPYDDGYDDAAFNEFADDVEP